MPILVTEFGIVAEVRMVHPEKAASPIHVTEAGISHSVFALGQLINMVLFKLKRTPFSEA